MKLVVGLGNPGSQYAGTRHNVGWMVLDRLADRAGWAGRGRQRDASTSSVGRYRGLDLTLVKPLTYMNESGLAVRKVLAREHAPLSISSSSPTTSRCRSASCASARAAATAGTTACARSSTSSARRSSAGCGSGSAIRSATVVDHVLSKFEPDESQRLDELLDAAADGVEAWAREGTSKAANRFNTFELRPADADRIAAPGEVDGPPGDDGIRRTQDRLAARPAAARTDAGDA